MSQQQADFTAMKKKQNEAKRASAEADELRLSYYAKYGTVKPPTGAKKDDDAPADDGASATKKQKAAPEPVGVDDCTGNLYTGKACPLKRTDRKPAKSRTKGPDGKMYSCCKFCKECSADTRKQQADE